MSMYICIYGGAKTKSIRGETAALCDANISDSVNRLEEPLQREAAHYALVRIKHAKLRTQ